MPWPESLSANGIPYDALDEAKNQSLEQVRCCASHPCPPLIVNPNPTDPTESKSKPTRPSLSSFGFGPRTDAGDGRI
ncbi:uncharacterized protein BKA78DRAFT_303039 [Phyllosticta capitalensis]|uniref:uncharacterized protein n=1 Tax=Phyllosticta capitalensis TaxID=121624 RepID=UPI00312EEEDD